MQESRGFNLDWFWDIKFLLMKKENMLYDF